MALQIFSGTSASRAASTKTGNAGDLAIETDTGNLAVADGSSLLGLLKRLTRIDEVTAAVQQYVTSTLLTNSLVSQLVAETGYTYAIVDASGRLGAGLTGDGYWVAKFRFNPGSVTYTALDPDMSSRVLASGLGAAFQQLAPESQMLFAITDPSNRIGFGVAADGSLVGKFVPPDGAVTFAKLGTDAKSLMLGQIAPENGYSFPITDPSGRLAFGIKTDSSIDTPGGVSRALHADAVTPVDSFIECKTDTSGNRQLYRVKRLGGTRTLLTVSGSDNYEPRYTSDGYVLFRQSATGGAVDKCIPPGSATIYPATTTLDKISCFGDSLTMGNGASNPATTSYPARLAAVSGLPVNNFGIGGQLSSQIAARQGGAPSAFLAPFTIPADTSAVTVTPQVDLMFTNSGTTPPMSVTIAGVAGTLTKNGGTGVYTFNRTTAGQAVTVPSTATITVTTSAVGNDSSVQILWTGRNDLNRGSVTDTTGYLAPMVTYLKPYAKKFLVLGITGKLTEPSGSTGYALLNSTNATDAAIYGDSFVDVNRYLIINALTIMANNGMSPTAQDLTDLSNDLIPTSLHTPDGLHFIDATYDAIARLAYSTMVSKGWFL